MLVFSCTNDINKITEHSDLRLQNPGKSASCHDSVSNLREDNITLRNSTLLYTMTIFSYFLSHYSTLRYYSLDLTTVLYSIEGILRSREQVKVLLWPSLRSSE